MFSFPSSRRLVTPALLLVTFAVFIRLCLQVHTLIALGPSQYILESFAKSSWDISFEVFLSSQTSLQDRYLAQYHSSIKNVASNPHISALLPKCKYTANPHTGHIRLSRFPILNISMLPSAADSNPNDFRDNKYFNPAIIPLPSHIARSSSTPYQYLLVSRLVTSGTHQESHICFANICVPPGSSSRSRICTEDEIEILGPHGGMRCVTRPEKVNIPSTPARKCTGSWSVFPDIPGFHDPRVFWSGRGEPLIEVNSGSTYGCVGLWLQDLRAVFPPLKEILERKKGHGAKDDGNQNEEKSSGVKETNALGAITGYSRLTELSRNPRKSRNSVEKNWIVFFPSEDEMWIQYNAMGKAKKNTHSNSTLSSSQSPGRTLSQVLSHVRATKNLTSPFEPSCFPINSSMHTADPLNNTGHWHQGTNSLRLILCSRPDFRARTCLIPPPDMDVQTLPNRAYEELLRKSGAIVHFSIIHRKFTNEMDLPMRYERYVTVWEARPPHRLVAVSQYPIVFGEERLRPWSVGQDGSREDKKEIALDGDGRREEEDDAYFTYTPSIAWTYREQSDEARYVERGYEDLGTGYLDDEVIVGIGMDDLKQGFVRVPVKELLSCLRRCPGL